MRRDELAELHYITPIENVPSILLHGLLCHRLADKHLHTSVAMQGVQDRRQGKTVSIPNGRPLHDYVNLYFCARNPMMYVRRDLHLTLCVLRISTDVLDLPDTAIADQNASTGRARFYPSPDGMEHIDRDMVFAEYWTNHPDDVTRLTHKTIKCAELLVPQRVDPKHIVGAYVSCEQSRENLAALCAQLPVTINGHTFFR